MAEIISRFNALLLLGSIVSMVPTIIQAQVAVPPTAESPGASQAFTSTDPVVVKARELVEAGSFQAAEAMLSGENAKQVSESMRARAELLDVMHRIRYEYSLNHAGLLAKVQKLVPDASATDVERWAEETKSRFRKIDGEKLYFRREPQNIFLFSTEAKERRSKAGNAPKQPTWQLTGHLAKIIAEAESSELTEVVPVKHRVTHTITIKKNNPAIKPGSIVRVWAPFAQEYRQQRDVKLISASPEPKLIAPSGVEGHPVSGGAQRTIYFERKVTDPAEPLVFNAVFQYTSFAYYPKLDKAKVEPLPADWNAACLGERLPHIVFTPEIRKEVATIVGDETNPLVKARKIFRWVSVNIPWNAEDEYCIIPSFAVKGFNARCGDCGVQNTLFITMCRIAGIPARWQSGFETKPIEAWGMHDWAEIYIAPWGWLPADASYGIQKSDDPRIADFYCGHQDSYRLIVNLDWGRDLIPPKHSLRSEPADFQRGEVEVDGKNLYFDQWEAKTEVER